MTCIAAQGAAAQESHLLSIQQTKRRITLDDILLFERLTDLRISPDGRSVLYVMVKPGSQNVYGERSTLWLLDLATRRVRKLAPVRGDRQDVLGADPQPEWSPDGHQVAYLSSQSGRPEIWTLDIASGRRRQITHQGVRGSNAINTSGTIREFTFSPSGDRLAYVRAVVNGEPEKREKQTKVIAVSEHPYFFSSDGVDGSYAGAALVEMISLKSGRRERLTPRLIGASWLQWSPDGTKLTFVTLPDAWRGARVGDVDPIVLTIATKEMKRLVRTWSIDYRPVWAPDGSTIAYLSHAPDSPRPFFLLPLARSLYTCGLFDVRPQIISGDDLTLSFMHPVVWARSNIIYAESRNHATARVYALAPDGTSYRLVTPKQFHVRTYSLSADGRRMAAIFEDANTPPEIYVGDPAIGAFEKMTNLGSVMKGIALGQVEVARWRSGDHRFDVEGFLVKPPGFTPGKPYPLLVNMHGGPRALYENGFVEVNFTSGYHSPAQLYAAEGYLVLLPNKRGDEGYGAEFAGAHTKHWGDDVEYDMLAGVDDLIVRGLADSTKLGVMGHSYGGYATAWAIAHTGRFKAASINDGPVNLLSYYGQMYLVNDIWMDPLMGGNPSAVQEEYLKRSPILYADNISTPTLLRYGQSKFPRPTGIPFQGMELFRALHQRGVPVEFVYHPTQGHVILDEEVYRDWVRRNLHWFDYWMMRKGTNPIAAVQWHRSVPR